MTTQYSKAGIEGLSVVGIGSEGRLSKSSWQECMYVHLSQRSIPPMLPIESSYRSLVLLVHHNGVLRGARVCRI